jgi:hypothetical protein
MKFTLTKGVWVEGDIVPMEKRGTILPSTKENQERRFEMSTKSPRAMGKNLKHSTE